MTYTTILSSPLGPLHLASDGTALTGLWIEGQKYFALNLETDTKELTTHHIFSQAEAWLNAYFTGNPLPPCPPLAPTGSTFRQAVWKLLLEIPFGQTTTYGSLAKTLQKQGISAAPQAVGGAVGHNPISIIIPCHRVLGVGRSLTGYAGGLEKKEFLLKLEGVL